MVNAIILHGRPDKEEYFDPKHPSASNDWWIPWLQKQLLINDVAAQTPEVPNSWKPKYSDWEGTVKQFEINPNTILVGHSCGGSFWIRWLSENKTAHVGKVILVAPSLGLNWNDRSFFDYEIDPELASRTKGIVIFGSDNDNAAVIEGISQYRFKIKNTKYREFPGYAHFAGSPVKQEFPELLSEILKK